MRFVAFTEWAAPVELTTPQLHWALYASGIPKKIQVISSFDNSPPRQQFYWNLSTSYTLCNKFRL